MDDLHTRLVGELHQTARIYNASVLVAEVRFIVDGLDSKLVRCRVWYDLDQRAYRAELSHSLPGMTTSGTQWAETPEGALKRQLERFGSGYGPATIDKVELVENPSFDDPNIEG